MNVKRRYVQTVINPFFNYILQPPSASEMYLHPPAPNDVSRFLSDMLDITGNILQDHRGINVWPRPQEHTSFLDELDKRRPFVITTRPAAGEGVVKHDGIYVDSTHYSTRRLTIISRFSELYFCYMLYTKKNPVQKYRHLSVSQCPPSRKDRLRS